MTAPRPYTDTVIGEGQWFREFSDKGGDESEFVWHRDHKDRCVTVIDGDGWFLQMDDQMPVPLVVGESYDIGHGMYHRLIRGDAVAGNLRLMIDERNKNEK